VLPGVATVASALPGFTSMNWTALFVLRGTPPTVRDRLEQAARQAVASPEMQKLFADRAFEPFPLSRDELRAFLAAEAVRWREAVRSSGARAD
jgi:tripartite-type tricarboxylate transporter receptor subunit TctC